VMEIFMDVIEIFMVAMEDVFIVAMNVLMAALEVFMVSMEIYSWVVFGDIYGFLDKQYVCCKNIVTTYIIG